jgi:hypothetical protein
MSDRHKLMSDRPKLISELLNLTALILDSQTKLNHSSDTSASLTEGAKKALAEPNAHRQCFDVIAILKSEPFVKLAAIKNHDLRPHHGLLVHRGLPDPHDHRRHDHQHRDHHPASSDRRSPDWRIRNHHPSVL